MPRAWSPWPWKPGHDIGLLLAVRRQGIGLLVLQVAAEVGRPGPAAGGGIDQAQGIELVVEGHRAKLRGVERQQELPVGEGRGRHAPEGQGFAAGQMQHHVRPGRGHRRANLRGRGEAVALQLQLAVGLPVVDDVVALAGLLDEGRALGGRTDQHVIAGAAVDPLVAVDHDQVVEAVSHRVVEVAVDGQVLDVGRQGDRGVADTRCRSPPAGLFLHAVVRIVDEEGVVAAGSDQQVAAAVAVDQRRARGRSQGLIAGARTEHAVRGLGALGDRDPKVVVVSHGAVP